MKAAIYCRVSTEDQEKEGTSLDTQQEAGLKVAEDRITDYRITLRPPRVAYLRNALTSVIFNRKQCVL